MDDFNIDNFFQDESTKPESNWFKFEKVGDKVAGVVVDVFEKEGNGTLPDQKVFCLRKKDGEEVNVGIKKTNEFLMNRTKFVRKGDLLGFEFTKEIPATVKGYNPAKSIEPRLKYTKDGDSERMLEGLPARAIA